MDSPIQRALDKQLHLMRWLAGQELDPPQYVSGGLAVAITRLRKRGWVGEGSHLTLRGRQKLNTWLAARKLPLVPE